MDFAQEFRVHFIVILFVCMLSFNHLLMQNRKTKLPGPTAVKFSLFNLFTLDT